MQRAARSALHSLSLRRPAIKSVALHLVWAAPRSCSHRVGLGVLPAALRGGRGEKDLGRDQGLFRFPFCSPTAAEIPRG